MNEYDNRIVSVEERRFRRVKRYSAELPSFQHLSYLLSLPSLLFLPALPLPLHASWTERWYALEGWMRRYNGADRGKLIHAYQVKLLQHTRETALQAFSSCEDHGKEDQELSDVLRCALESLLAKFFGLIEQVKKEFDLAPTRNDPSNIEVFAKEAMRQVQGGIDQLCQTHRFIRDQCQAPGNCPICLRTSKSDHNVTRYICEWLFVHVGSLEIPGFEKDLESALERISRLSFRMGPATSRSKKLRQVLQTALFALTRLHNHDEYHAQLDAFKGKQSALLLALLKHADSINSEDSKLPGQLCLELQQIAHNLAGFAMQRADRHQQVYEYLLKNREAMSECLDSANKGQGQVIVDDLINDLKELSSFSRREVDYWKRQSQYLSSWRDLNPIYRNAIHKMSNLQPSEQTDHGSSSASGDNPPTVEAHNVAEAARRVSVSYSKLPTLQDGRVRKFLLKTQPDVSNLLDKTKGHFEHVVKETTTQPSKIAAASIVANVSSVAESWKWLYRKVKCAVFVFEKVYSSKICVTSCALAKELDLKASTNDRRELIIDIGIISKNLHPSLSDLERRVLDMKQEYISFANFLLTIDIPSMFPDLNDFT